MKTLHFSMAFCLFISPATISATELHDLEALETQLSQFLGGETAQIDRRMKLAKCPEQPQFSARGSSALVECQSLGWRFSVRLQNAVHEKNQTVIARGQPVLMVARRNGFTVSSQMIADKAGRVGDMIPVRESRRSAPVMAQITGAGRVEIPHF